MITIFIDGDIQCKNCTNCIVHARGHGSGDCWAITKCSKNNYSKTKGINCSKFDEKISKQRIIVNKIFDGVKRRLKQ